MDANELEIERLKHKIEILVEKVENAKLQSGHCEAIVISERRQWDRISEGQKENRKLIDKHEKTLYNDGKGIVYEIHGMLQREKERNKTWHSYGIIVGIIIAVISLIKQFIK